MLRPKTGLIGQDQIEIVPTWFDVTRTDDKVQREGLRCEGQLVFSHPQFYKGKNATSYSKYLLDSQPLETTHSLGIQKKNLLF